MACRKKINPDREYIESGRWKCPDSPTGAHHWVRHDRVWICKYCGDAQKFPRSWSELVQIGGASHAPITPPREILPFGDSINL